MFGGMFEKIFEKPIASALKKELKSVNPIKSEHLKSGIKPIMACVGTIDEFKQNENERIGFFEKMVSKDIPNTRNINYYGSHEELIDQGFKNSSDYSYVISKVDNSDKFSKSFKNCTGVIVTGCDKETGKNISFLSHQDPKYFLNEDFNKNKFTKDLREQLLELKQKSVNGTIDAIIFGGNYFKEKDYSEFRENYFNSIKLLLKEIKGILGFEPVVIVGPKTKEGGKEDDVFYDNDNRLLYMIRPNVGDATTESFLPSDMEKQKKKW